MSFAEILKAKREESGLSQAQLAAAADVSLSTICKFEYGIREPTYGTLLKLAQAFGGGLELFNPPTRRRRKGK